MKFSKYISKAVTPVMALFQKQHSCLSNKATTICGYSVCSLRQVPVRHNRGGKSTENKVRLAPPTMCRLTLVIDGDISFSRIFLNYRFNDIPARLSYNHTIRKRYGKSVRREKIMKNFLKLGGLSILSCQYMYVDHEDYLADALFAQNQVPVRFGHEFKRNGSPYCIITCRVWKKDIAGFERTMESLYNKMLLLGHSDYAEFCEELMGMIEKERGAA